MQTSQILIVDDEIQNVELLRDILISNGFSNIASFQDPMEAVSFFEKHDFDLILLDIMMPGLNGLEILERFRELRPDHDTPVIVISALYDRDTQLQILRGDGSEYLTKPIDEEELLAKIENILKARYEKKNLEVLVDYKSNELEKAKYEVVKRLSIAAEYRDNETGMHLKRMASYSMLLAKEIGWDERRCEMVLKSAPMHDIGKIGIPDYILLKPGKLNEKESAIMKTHPIIGGKILSNGTTSLIQMAKDVALNHHEKWDGSGYPYGKKGKEITLIGRIVAVADVFDALTSDRSYKKAWTVDETLSEMRSMANSHFDPHLILKFLGIIPEILKIKNEFLD